MVNDSKWVSYVGQWHRLYSVRWNIVGALLTAAANGASIASGAAAWSDSFGTKVVLVLATLIFLASIAGALIKQDLPPPRPKSNAGMNTGR